MQSQKNDRPSFQWLWCIGSIRIALHSVSFRPLFFFFSFSFFCWKVVAFTCDFTFCWVSFNRNIYMYHMDLTFNSMHRKFYRSDVVKIQPRALVCHYCCVKWFCSVVDTDTTKNQEFEEFFLLCFVLCFFFGKKSR